MNRALAHPVIRKEAAKRRRQEGVHGNLAHIDIGAAAGGRYHLFHGAEMVLQDQIPRAMIADDIDHPLKLLAGIGGIDHTGRGYRPQRVGKGLLFYRMHVRHLVKPDYARNAALNVLLTDKIITQAMVLRQHPSTIDDRGFR
jgi:hypothetical protein